ncbi:MAG TPA: FkbM family methyltransferase [Longimicrobiales bacterium]|nr:FkbM family methyltransferase [Longimicrobiales bacterium]
MTEALRFAAVRLYAQVYGVAKDAAGVNLPGLGFALRRIRQPRILEVRGRRIWFDPAVAGAYERLVAGSWSEKETHAFLRRVLDAVPGPVGFADVGASIGALAIDVAGHPGVDRVWAFEPVPASAAACRRSAELNGFGHLRVVEKALTEGVPARMRMDARAPTGSRLEEDGEAVGWGTLDGELADASAPLVLLLDVEGAEPRVLRGGRDVLARTRPLVIFEYNEVSRRAFALEEVRAALGAGYWIRRLRGDARLDARTEEAWNCVAVPEGSPFEPVCRELELA